MTRPALSHLTSPHFAFASHCSVLSYLSTLTQYVLSVDLGKVKHRFAQSLPRKYCTFTSKYRTAKLAQPTKSTHTDACILRQLRQLQSQNKKREKRKQHFNSPFSCLCISIFIFLHIRLLLLLPLHTQSSSFLFFVIYLASIPISQPIYRD